MTRLKAYKIILSVLICMCSLLTDLDSIGQLQLNMVGWQEPILPCGGQISFPWVLMEVSYGSLCLPEASANIMYCVHYVATNDNIIYYSFVSSYTKTCFSQGLVSKLGRSSYLNLLAF